MLWLVLWYVFCALNIALLLWVFRALTQPRFRDEIGDITTEVGYEEDSCGRLVSGYRTASSEEAAEPHIMPPAGR